jgi:hypothetical protein
LMQPDRCGDMDKEGTVFDLDRVRLCRNLRTHSHPPVVYEVSVSRVVRNVSFL